MNIASLSPQVPTSGLSMEQLERSPNVSDAQKIAEVSRQFEAVLLRQILADATKNMFSTGENTNSAAQGIYQDMITNSLADNMSRAGGMGLARVIAKQLQHESKTASASASDASKV